MAVVNITGGVYSTSTSTVTVYTVPSGRSARLEVNHTANRSTYNDAFIRMGTGYFYHRYSDANTNTNINRATWGSYTPGTGGSDNATIRFGNTTGTYYLPSGATFRAEGTSGTYVAIEEDDG